MRELRCWGVHKQGRYTLTLSANSHRIVGLHANEAEDSLYQSQLSILEPIQAEDTGKTAS